MFDYDEEKYVKNEMTEERFKEELDYFNNHPLFMKEISQESLETNQSVIALQNLLYNDTPENTAKHFNKKGNETMTNKILKGVATKFYLNDAMKNYNEALAANYQNDEFNAKVHSNIAFLHMKMKNFGHAIDSCKAAIKIFPAFIKPYYRMGQAYEQLNKYSAAIDILQQAQVIDKNEQNIRDLLKNCQNKVKELEKQEKIKNDSHHQKQQELYSKLAARGYYLGRDRTPVPGYYERDIIFDSDGIMHTPILIIYPEFRQTDFIEDAREDHELVEHLSIIFADKLPWDTKNCYNLSSIEVYIEKWSVAPISEHIKCSGWNQKKKKKMIKINTHDKIHNIIRTKGYILPKLLEIYVVTQKSDYYPNFKKEYSQQSQ